jgi:hypothetical protein
MQRRTLLLGMAAAALPLPALALPAPRWRSMSKRRFGPSRVYGPAIVAIRLPVPEDVPAFATLALKLSGGPLWLGRVDYVYADRPTDAHRLEVAVGRNEIAGLPAPAARLIAIDIVSKPYCDGHRYWHLIGADA